MKLTHVQNKQGLVRPQALANSRENKAAKKKQLLA
jgi:hypothetical protein